MPTLNKLARDLEAFQEADQLRVLGVSDRNSRDAPEPQEKVPMVELFGNLNLGDSEEVEEYAVDILDSGTNNGTRITLDTTEITMLDSLGPLPSDIFEEILLFVGENWFTNCVEACPGWEIRTQSELIWRHVCLKTFRKPAFKPLSTINGVPRKFKSWHLAAQRRPRVKFSGVYVHTHSYIRDRGPDSMWTVGSSRFLEIKHYRYVMFLSSGEVIYASTPIEPSKIFPEIHRAFLKLSSSQEKEFSNGFENHIGNFEQNESSNKVRRTFFGRFKVSGNELSFVADLGDYSVKFTFEVDNIETITVSTHESLLHPKKDHKRVKTKGRQRSSVGEENDWHSGRNTFDDVEEHKIVQHPLSALYRFEKEWKFQPLF